MSKQRMSMLIAAGIGVLAAFLPWATVLAFSVSGISGSGVITLALYAITAALMLLGDKNSNLTGGKFTTALILSGLGSFVGIYEMINISSKLGASKAGAFLSQSISIGIGLYLTILAGIAVIVLAFVQKNK
ncbi:MAG: hypothetical protein GY940_10855 [bacterium]|nr:hypothetical protein [bacterium]